MDPCLCNHTIPANTIAAVLEMNLIEEGVGNVADKLPVLYPGTAATARRIAPRPRTSSSTASSSKATVAESLDDLLGSLETIRSSLSGDSSSTPSPPVVQAETKAAIARSQKAFNDRTKEVYNALAKLGKAYDKKFTTSVEGIADPNLFMGDEAQQALEAVVMDHLLRMGEWDAAQQLSQVSPAYQASEGSVQCHILTLDTFFSYCRNQAYLYPHPKSTLS